MPKPHSPTTSAVRLAAALVLPLLACADDDDGGQNDEESSSSAGSESSPTTTSPTATSVDPSTETSLDTSSGSTSDASESSSGGEVSLLERVALALGGAEELAALDGFVLTAEGTTRNADEGATPEDTIVDGSAFTIDLSVDVANAGWRLDHDRTITFAGLGLPMQYSEIISGDIGAIDGVDNLFGAPGGAMPSDRWGAIVRRQQLLNPQLLIIAALADPTIATDLGPADLDGVAHDRLAIANEIAELVLWIDPATDLPVRLTTLENNWLRRDVELQLDYEGWAASDGGVLFAAGVTLAIDGEVLHEETRSAISTTAELAPELFEIPPDATSMLDEAAAARGRMNHSLLLEFQGVGIPAWGFQDQVVPVVLAPAATHLTGGTHHSVIVEQENGLVLLETPLYEARCQALLDWAATEYPSKSVTHAVVSHYHVDHAGCARTLVARGATLVVGEGSDVVWTEVLAAPSTIDPDELSANPVEATIEYVPDGGSFVIDDANAAVTVFDLPNSHSSDMVLPFVESAGLVFVADLFNPGTPAQLSPDGAQSLLDAFELYGITGQVDIIAAAHGFGTATVADLQNAVP